MLKTFVEKLEPGLSSECEYCGGNRAEARRENEDQFYLCADCAMQVARAFLEDLHEVLPEYGREMPDNGGQK